MLGNPLILAVPPHVRPAAAGVRGAVVVDVVEEGLGDHLHLRALDPSPARSEACQVRNRGLLDDRWPVRFKPGARVSNSTPLPAARPNQHLRKVEQGPDKHLHELIRLHGELEEQILRVARLEML